MIVGVNVGAGFGNRLFQMAFAFAFSKKYNSQFKFENWENPSHHSKDVYPWLVQRFMDLDNYVKEPIGYEQNITEPDQLFLQHLDFYAQIKQENVYLYGFFQNEKYFKEYRESLCQLFRPPEAVKTLLDTYPDIQAIRDGYFLHVRIGDYWKHNKHWVNLENYYLKVLDMLEEDAMVVVFCEDYYNIPKVYPKVALRLQQQRKTLLITEPNEILSFYLMWSCGRGGCCANSTYSWWAGWLNENPDKKVYMPGQWMGVEGYPCDIHFEGSIVVDIV